MAHPVQAAPEYDALENNAPEATKGISVHQKKSKRMRTVLIVVSAVLVVLIAALGYFAFMLYQEASDVASQASNSTVATLKDTAEATDAKKQGSRLTAPNLVALLGSTEDEAISKVGRGATVASSSDITEEKGRRRFEDHRSRGQNGDACAYRAAGRLEGQYAFGVSHAR